MTKTELRAMIRTLSLLTASDVDDTGLDTLIDEGFIRILRARPWPWALAASPTTVPMVAGQSKYTVTGATHILSVIDDSQELPLDSVSMAQWAKIHSLISSESRPTVFAWASPTLYIMPTPATTDDLLIYHYEVPVWAAETPPFSSLFHTILADWAIHRLWEREEEFSRSEQYRMRFEDGLAEMQRYYNTESVDGPKIYGQAGSVITPSNMPFIADANLGGM